MTVAVALSFYDFHECLETILHEALSEMMLRCYSTEYVSHVERDEG